MQAELAEITYVLQIWKGAEQRMLEDILPMTNYSWWLQPSNRQILTGAMCNKQWEILVRLLLGATEGDKSGRCEWRRGVNLKWWLMFARRLLARGWKTTTLLPTPTTNTESSVRSTLGPWRIFWDTENSISRSMSSTFPELSKQSIVSYTPSQPSIFRRESWLWDARSAVHGISETSPTYIESMYSNSSCRACTHDFEFRIITKLARTRLATTRHSLYFSLKS